MWIPFLVLGLLSGSGGVASAWLPETRGFPLCQTVGDVTELRKNQKFFSWNRAKKRNCDSQNDETNAIELLSHSPESDV